MAGKCPMCGHDMSPSAKRCYHCGYDREELVKSFDGTGWSGCLIIIASIICVAGLLNVISRNFLLGLFLIILSVVLLILSVKRM